MPNNANSSDRLQLELFEAQDDRDRGWLSPVVARAQVSPGWWPRLAPIFRDEGMGVTRCEERDGRLVLEFETEEDEGPEFGSQWVMLLQQAVERTCGACGLGPAHPRILGDHTIRVLCDTCRPQVSDAISFAARADSFWRFDGERRPAQDQLPPLGASPARADGERIRPPLLPPHELRQLVRRVGERMGHELRGQDEARFLLALLGTLHVTGDLPRGPRVLLTGRTGTGKSTSVVAMRNALEAEGFSLPAIVFIDATRLSSPGWHGMNLPDAVELAVRGHREPSKAIVVIDELDKIGIRPQDSLSGNMAKKREEIVYSLLGALAGAELLGEGGMVWDSRGSFIVGVGAFAELLEGPIDAHALVMAGLPLEIATRFETVIRLAPLDEHVVRDIVRHSQAVQSAIAMCERLGYPLALTPEALAHAARMHALSNGSETPRSAIRWVVTAIRGALLRRLKESEEDTRPVVITPDSLMVPPQIARPRGGGDPHRDSGPDDSEGWVPR